MKDKKAFTLAETQKNNSLATYRGRGIKGEGVIKHAAFTLAETMIVLVILGIVAAITIPALVRNQIEAQNRTRIKKAMTVYDTAINKMVVENNLKSNDALYSSNPDDNSAFAPQGNCTRTSAYFKILRTLDDDNGTNCRFCSSDNVCWDISNILKPIIGIGEEGITNENSTNRYRMFAHFGDNGELRVDDVAYEGQHNFLTEDEKTQLNDLFNFINNTKTSSNMSGSIFSRCDKNQPTCEIDGIEYVKIEMSDRTETYCFYDEELNEDCTKESKAVSGTYYITNNGGNKTWDDAKKTCAEGTHMATIAELKNLYESGDLKCKDDSTSCHFWAAEEYDSDAAYNIQASSGYIHSDYFKDGSLGYLDIMQTLCIGK